MFKSRSLSITIFLIIFLPISLTYAKLHDPTRPPNAVGSCYGSAGGIKPGLVLLTQDRKIIWMSGRFMTVGDKFMNGTIVEIDSNYIVLKNRDGEVKLSLNDGSMKRDLG